MGTVLGHDIDTSMLITLDSNTWGLGLVVSLFGTLSQQITYFCH